MEKKIVLVLFLVGWVSGCSLIAKELDATWTGSRNAYEKGVPLPPLEVRPELAVQSEKKGE